MVVMFPVSMDGSVEAPFLVIADPRVKPRPVKIG
jgi:hypothetical protein